MVSDEIPSDTLALFFCIVSNPFTDSCFALVVLNTTSSSWLALLAKDILIKLTSSFTTVISVTSLGEKEKHVTLTE